jgi:hypothetical protein
VLSVDGVDGSSAWFNAEQVAGGYRTSHAIQPIDGNAFGYNLPAAKRVALTPYMVSFMAMATGDPGTYASMEYGPLIRPNADWQRVTYVVRWPMTDAGLAGSFRVGGYRGSLSSLLIDDLTVVRMEHSQFAAWSDTVMTSLGGDVPAFTDASRLDLLPTTRGILAAGGTIRCVFMGDSLSGATSYAAGPELIERSFPGVRWESYSVAIGGSTAAVWNQAGAVAAMRASIAAVDANLLIWADISDEYKTASDWDTLIGNLKSIRDDLAPTADILVGSKLFAWGASTSDFVRARASAHGVGFFDADAKFREWYGGDADFAGTTKTFSRPDGTHPDYLSREYLGRALAWFFGAHA